MIPRAQELRLVPVGRLDRNSAGLLLVTNDIAWINTVRRVVVIVVQNQNALSIALHIV